jgi:hypothetical protein
MSDHEKALKPEDLTRLFVERANAGDTVGREAIHALWVQVLAKAPRFAPEPPLPTLISGDIALTSTPPKDGAGARAQVARRQPDGTWLRLLDQPEFVTPVG